MDYDPFVAKHCAEASEHIYSPELPLISNSLECTWFFPKQRSPIEFPPGNMNLQRVGLYESNNYHIVAFEGTIPMFLEKANLLSLLESVRSLADWIDDARIRTVSLEVFQGMVHEGFARQFLSIEKALMEKLSEINPEVLVLTGHSQGGALAVLATNYFRKAGRKVDSCYTFAAPRAGDKDLCQAVDDIVCRFEYGNDVVPLLPPTTNIGPVLKLFPSLNDRFRATPYSSAGTLRYGGGNGGGQFFSADEEKKLAFGRVLTAVNSPKNWVSQHSMKNYRTIL